MATLRIESEDNWDSSYIEATLTEDEKINIEIDCSSRLSPGESSRGNENFSLSKEQAIAMLKFLQASLLNEGMISADPVVIGLKTKISELQSTIVSLNERIEKLTAVKVEQDKVFMRKMKGPYWADEKNNAYTRDQDDVFRPLTNAKP